MTPSLNLHLHHDLNAQSGIQDSVQSGLELIHRVAIDNIRRKRTPSTANSICEKSPTQVIVVTLQFKLITMIPGSAYIELKYIPIIDIVKATKHFKHFDELATQSPGL